MRSKKLTHPDLAVISEFGAQIYDATVASAAQYCIAQIVMRSLSSDT